ncbi:hypothetical protein CYL18_04245 [Pradoshia eiseniae]|uniref:Uncharacterized protein n=1 Tax=Pradoshia eiseniae TaxID=2064768 RepID=A0A2S7N4T4_9BACI|nr:hypothetical protein [Pradoshia eiseniae]PQD97092.1 hypothetical protein CYL18_04245 [Pradoshia eiseniae]
MYYPLLSNLRRKQINNHDIDLLDWWLGTRRANTRRHLNPLQFSLDCKIDTDHSIRLFSLCALDENLGLLSVRYVSRCPNCDTVLSTQEQEFVPKIRDCYECGGKYNQDILKDKVEIYFSLNCAPQENIMKKEEVPIGGGQGKAVSLQGLMVRNMLETNDELSGLFECFL